MYKTIFTLLFVFSSIFSYSQEDLKPYVQTIGKAYFIPKPIKYIANIVISKNQVYNSINKEDITLKNIKESYYKKLKNNGLKKDRFIESKLKYTMYNSDNNGTVLYFETSSKEEFANLLSIKSDGVVILYKDVVLEITNKQKEELVKNALKDAEQKANVIAKKSHKKLGKLLMIKDDNYLKTKEALYFYTEDQKIYQLTVRYELL